MSWAASTYAVRLNYRVAYTDAPEWRYTDAPEWRPASDRRYWALREVCQSLAFAIALAALRGVEAIDPADVALFRRVNARMIAVLALEAAA